MRGLSNWIDNSNSNPVLEHLLKNPPVPYQAESKSWLGAGAIKIHKHDDLYQLDYFWGGAGRYEINGIAYDMDEHVFFLSCPGDEHAIEVPAGEDTHSYGLKFQWTPLSQGGKHVFHQLKKAFALADSEQKQMVDLLRKAVGHTVLDDGEHRIHASNILREILVLLLQLHFENRLGPCHATGRKASICQQVTSYLQKHMACQVTLSELSRHVQVSPFHLARMFATQTGKTPHEALTQMRLDRAKALLQNTPLTIPEVASKVGIKKPAYFSTLFRKRYGLAPRSFRRKQTTNGTFAATHRKNGLANMPAKGMPQSDRFAGRRGDIQK